MGVLDQIIEQRGVAPPRVMVYGLPGVGKTTLAASANAVIVDLENGALTVPGARRTPLVSTYSQLIRTLNELADADPSKVGAVCIDTADAMMRLVEVEVKDRDSKGNDPLLKTIGGVHGGFFKGREVVKNFLDLEIFPALNRIHANGNAIIILAHAKRAKITQPDGITIQQSFPEMDEYVGNRFIQWVDATLYALVNASGERVLITDPSPNILAKNRYGLPPTLPLHWPTLCASIEEGISRREAEFTTTK